uniref:Uncharacterized protein n=1 Tax=Strombidium rassoulzadegani TaxID=1082188 RepID=A0A7S3FU66_9SPIT
MRNHQDHLRLPRLPRGKFMLLSALLLLSFLVTQTHSQIVDLDAELGLDEEERITLGHHPDYVFLSQTSIQTVVIISCLFLGVFVTYLTNESYTWILSFLQTTTA